MITGFNHTSFTVARYKEWWGDQAAGNDVLEIAGTNVVTPVISPRTKRVNALFAFDDGVDGVTNLAAPIPELFALPFISGAIFFTLIVNTIAALQIFAEVYTMFFTTRSGPAQDSALFYTIYLFQKAFQDLDLGYASAMAWLLFVIILIITAFQIWGSRRFVYYAGDDK